MVTVLPMTTTPPKEKYKKLAVFLQSPIDGPDVWVICNQVHAAPIGRLEPPTKRIPDLRTEGEDFQKFSTVSTGICRCRKKG